MRKSDTCFISLVECVEDRDAGGTHYDPALFQDEGEYVALVSFEGDSTLDTLFKADTFEEVETALRGQLPHHDLTFIRCAA